MIDSRGPAPAERLDRLRSSSLKEAGAPTIMSQEDPMELLNFGLMFVTAFILLRKPEKERLAFRLLIVSVLLMIVLFSIATRTALLPGVNY